MIIQASRAYAFRFHAPDITRQLSGNAPPSFVSDLICRAEKQGVLTRQEELEICYAGGALYSGGSSGMNTAHIQVLSVCNIYSGD